MNFFSLITSLFLLLFAHPTPLPTPPIPHPTPTPIVFHQYPASNITVNWGAPGPGYTIFMVSNMLPGDSEFREITVTNNGSTPRSLTLRSLKTFEFKNFSQILNFTIRKNGSIIYGPKLLAQFFTDSATASGISLGSLAGLTTATYKFTADFPSSAGNEYQLAKVVFNLKIGKLLPLPSPCPCSCYKNHDGQYPIHTYDKNVYADFDEGNKIECPNRFSCATVSNP